MIHDFCIKLCNSDTDNDDDDDITDISMLMSPSQTICTATSECKLNVRYSYQQKTTGQYLEWTTSQAVYIGQQNKCFAIVNCLNLLKLHKNITNQ